MHNPACTRAEELLSNEPPPGTLVQWHPTRQVYFFLGFATLFAGITLASTRHWLRHSETRPSPQHRP